MPLSNTICLSKVVYMSVGAPYEVQGKGTKTDAANYQLMYDGRDWFMHGEMLKLTWGTILEVAPQLSDYIGGQELDDEFGYYGTEDLVLLVRRPDGPPPFTPELQEEMRP